MEDIILPPGSKVIAVANSEGEGTYPIIEALKSRLARVEWPRPHAQLLASVLHKDLESLSCKVNCPEGIRIINRVISTYHLAAFITLIEDCQGISLDLRDYYELIVYLKNSPYPMDRIMEFLNDSQNVDLNAYERFRTKLRWRLEELLHEIDEKTNYRVE